MAYVDAVNTPKFQFGYANHAWLCLDLLEVLCQLAERGLAKSVRLLLEYPLKHCPEVLLYGWPMLIRGVVMAIPMPGHPIARQEEEKVFDDCKCLSDLIESPDAVLLLTDTCEIRWLPTLLCANANKVTITGALGFDSFLVMRHVAGPLLLINTSSKAETVVGSSLSTGVEEMSLGQKDSKPRLGCYLL
ncbi:hypothetical protein Lser_V15G14751 [Lactuca serriola]